MLCSSWTSWRPWWVLGGLGAVLGRSWGGLGVPWRCLGHQRLPGPSSRRPQDPPASLYSPSLGPSWIPKRGLGAVLGLSWRSWGRLGAGALGQLGALFVAIWPTPKTIEKPLGFLGFLRSGPVSGRSWRGLGASWDSLGAVWAWSGGQDGCLERPRRCLGDVLAMCWRCLGGILGA